MGRVRGAAGGREGLPRPSTNTTFRLAIRTGSTRGFRATTIRSARRKRRSPTPRPSLSSVRVRYLDRDAVLASLRELATRLGAERPEIQEIRLFGSLARGQRNPFADADLLVVLDASDLPVRERIPHYKPSRVPVPMDLTVCTRDELSR